MLVRSRVRHFMYPFIVISLLTHVSLRRGTFNPKIAILLFFLLLLLIIIIDSYERQYPHSEEYYFDEGHSNSSDFFNFFGSCVCTFDSRKFFLFPPIKIIQTGFFQTPKVYTSPRVDNSKVVPTTTTASLPANSSSASAADSATVSPNGGSVARAVLGTLAAIIIITIIAAFIVRRTRKRRDRLNEARSFNRGELEQPGMVQDFAAGPGVYPENDYRAPSINYVDRSLPPTPFASDMPQMNQRMAHLSNPFSSPPGSPFNSIEGHQEMGAPPMPGSNGPAPYGPYASNFPGNIHPMQTTPPGSPFAGGYAMQENPFATPPATVSRRLTPPSTPGAWPQTPNIPLLPGGAFGTNGYRDSGYSAAEAHVGQAHKVQVEVSMPKLEDLTRERTPPPPFTPVDPAANVNTTDYAAVNNTASDHPLPPRPPSSQTLYQSEDAYGGM
jgi:hypothetical protein